MFLEELDVFICVVFFLGVLFAAIVCMNQEMCAYQTRRIGIMVICIV